MAFDSPRATCARPASSGVMSRPDRHHKAQASLFDMVEECLTYTMLSLGQALWEQGRYRV